MKRTRVFLCVILSCVLLLGSSGCRPSMTFTEIIYDQRVEDVLDQAELEQLDNDIENEDKDDTIASVAEDDEADTERNRNRQDPSPGKGSTDQSVPKAKQDTTLMQKLPGNTAGQKQNDSSDASVPQGAGGGQGDGTQNNQQNQGSGASEGGGSGSSGGGQGGSGNSGEGGGNEAGGNPGGEGGYSGTEEEDGNVLRNVVDINGKVVTIPKNVQSLTATGELALIVEMLGGGEKLKASSASLKEGMAGRLFGSSWSGEVLWEGDGSAPISGSDFTRLLEAAPQLCMIQSGDVTFTEEQLQQLDEHGIQFITLPELNSSTRICEAVQLTGEVLQAQGKASEYIGYCNDVKRDMRALTGTFRPDGIDYDSGADGAESGNGVYALFISGWDPSATYSLRNQSGEIMQGQGMAVTQTGYLMSPVTEMLSLAGIANSAALQENNYSLTGRKLRIISPINNNFYNLVVRDESQGAKFNKQYDMTTTGSLHLGDEEFPAVIAGTRAAFDGIWNEKASNRLWGGYPYITTGYSSGYGFVDGTGKLVESTIHGDYTLCMAPSGAGDWCAGSVESILLPHWAAWRVRGMVSEWDVRNRIADFYQRFYGVSLTETDVNEILAGR